MQENAKRGKGRIGGDKPLQDGSQLVCRGREQTVRSLSNAALVSRQKLQAGCATIFYRTNALLR